MKVYVVYGYAFDEVFCNEVFDTFDKALKYVSDDFSGFITESIEDGTLDPKIAAVVLLRLITWVGTMYFKRPSDNEAYFEYTDPDDNNTGITYYIAELEVK
jgi:hypothetical protein